MNYTNLINNIVTGNINGTIMEVNMMLIAGGEPLAIINEGLLAGMNIVGEKFKNGEMFIPEVLMASRAMNAGMDLVKPKLGHDDIPSLGTVVIGTVKGDLHDIGKNLVVMMMESAGFKVINLGVDVTKEKFIAAAKENNADIIAMSAMLTTTMAYMNDVIKSCKAEGLDVQYMIGGAPVTDKYAKSIGACYTADATTATEKAKELV